MNKSITAALLGTLSALALSACSSEAIKKNIDRNLGREASTEIKSTNFNMKCESDGRLLELKYNGKTGTHAITAKFPLEKVNLESQGLCFSGVAHGMGFFLLDLRQTFTCYEDNYSALKQRTTAPTKVLLTTAVLSTTAVEEKVQKSKTIYRAKTESVLQVKDPTGKTLGTLPMDSCEVDEF